MAMIDFFAGLMAGRQIAAQRVIVPVIPDTPTMYLYGHKADSVVTYNGVELPNINAVWDKEKYPYARISVNDAGGWSVCFLDSPITLGSNLYCKAEYYEMRNDDWVRIPAIDLWVDHLLYNVKWTNHDILNSDDSVYLAASEPVYTYTETPNVIIDGVGYVGAVLPALPEWDNTKYPYAVLAWSDYAGKYALMCSKYRPFYTTTGVDGKSTNRPVVGVTDSVRYALEDNVWGLPESLLGTRSMNLLDGYFTIVWTNFDVLDDDGSVYMETGTTTDPNAPATPADPVLPIPTGATHCLYNGNEFAALTPWNIAVYPYVFLCEELFNTDEVIASRKPILFGEHAVGKLHINNHYEHDADSWGAWSKAGSSGETNGCQIWANYDVYDSDGVLQLAASDPVPVYGEIVGYSYNGVTLPELPEWDKETYPYAYIHSDGYNHNVISTPNKYYLCLYGKPAEWVSDTRLTYDRELGAKSFVYEPSKDTMWREIGSCSIVLYWGYSDNGIDLYWSNTDIPSYDGNAVFLEASEPIPVYE